MGCSPRWGRTAERGAEICVETEKRAGTTRTFARSRALTAVSVMERRRRSHLPVRVSGGFDATGGLRR